MSRVPKCSGTETALLKVAEDRASLVFRGHVLPHAAGHFCVQPIQTPPCVNLADVLSHDGEDMTKRKAADRMKFYLWPSSTGLQTVEDKFSKCGFVMFCKTKASLAVDYAS